MNIYRVFGIVGLILICAGLVSRKKTQMYGLDILGGICLGIYSIYLRDAIFITLQAVFTFVAIYEFVKNLSGAKKAQGLDK
jgi:hypothetical protein